MKLNTFPLPANKYLLQNAKIPKNFGNSNAESPIASSTADIAKPDSALFKAYNGVNDKKESVSNEELFDFLKASNIKREDKFEEIALAVADNDGSIKKQGFDFLKSFQSKNHLIWDSMRIFSESKEDGKINYKALKLIDSIMAPEPKFSSYNAPNHYTTVLKKSKNSDGNFDNAALDFLIKHSETLAKALPIVQDVFFKGLKNNEGNFAQSALAYADKKLDDNTKIVDLINELNTSKDAKGNFSYEQRAFNEELKQSFSQMTAPKVKSIAAKFPAEMQKEKDEFIALAKSIQADEKFNDIWDVIEESSSLENDKTGLKYDKPSVDFVKKLLGSSYNAKPQVLTVLKKINMPYEKYKNEDIEALQKLLNNVDKENIEKFLDGSIYKSGEKKGQFCAQNLEKYLDIYDKNVCAYGMYLIDKLVSCLSLEENDRALTTFQKLLNLSWKSDKGNGYPDEKLDRSLLLGILSLLCLEVEGVPRRKCYEPRIDGLNMLFTMKLPMSSKDAFENFITFQDVESIKKLENVDLAELGVKTGQISKGVFKCASEEQLFKFKDFLKDYLKDKNVKTVNLELNQNIRTIVELSTGPDWDKTKLFYDMEKGEPTTEVNECNWQKRISRTEKDFKKNLVTEIKYKLERKDIFSFDDEVFQSQTIKQYDKNGSLLYTEQIEKSPIDGVFNIKKTYPDGREEFICKASKSSNGIDMIEKNMTSFDGTKSNYRYEDDPMGNRILDYKITDKNGKVLLNQSVTFEVLDENHFVSSRNNKKFDIKVTDEKIIVKNLNNNETVEINLENFTKSNKEAILPLLKQLPGDELFAMKKLDLKAFSSNEKLNNAAFNPKEESISFKEDYKNLAVALHEWGHGKDVMAFKEIGEQINKDLKLKEIYTEEKKAFREHFSDSQLSHVGYFSADYHYLGADAVMEGIAETNTLLSTYPKNEIQAIRSHYWQQYFPRTVAYLAGLLN